MGLSSLPIMVMSIYILSTNVLFLLVVADSLQSYTPTCHDDDHSALLQFKLSFFSDKDASYFYEGAYSKVSSWKPNSNCCSWDGVECDVETGRLIGLDLSSSWLYGSINSSSSLFRLVHLERLNLAYNNFKFSQIPPTIRNFPRLRYLNLSYSGFSGHVPFEVSQLSKLSSLDISHNYDLFSNRGFLRSLAQNLTGLETLDLSDINISSTVPPTMANLSHLTSLHLSDCGLFGEFPGRIFKSHNLKVLDVTSNPALTGYFPADDYNGTSPDLISLKLSQTNISINLPSLIKRFPSLKELDVSSCNISEGPIPFSLGNLGDLIYLDLSNNKFNSQIPAAALGNLTQLTYLSLFRNNLLGPVPESLFNLINIHIIYLDHNNLSGTVELQRFLNLHKLTSLDLSYNNLELLAESRFLNNATTVLPEFEYLGLGGCNIREFPNFLRSQDSLRQLDLSGNKLRGQVPKWMWNTSTQTLLLLDISHNFLSGFDQPPAVLPSVNLQYLDLSFNMLGGSLLIPSPTSRISYYAISNNQITGQVPPGICNLTSLRYLDLSNNMLSGILPQCPGNFGDILEYLNLGNNLFQSNLPEVYTNGSYLRTVDISRNNFHGQLPRSLANCTFLETLVLSHNKFTDNFPSWLGDLTELKILIMDHNEFYGVIVKPKKKNIHFPVLHILDLSSNNFSGQFPFEYIFSGNGTTGVTHDLEDGYISSNTLYYGYISITIISKGVERYYPKIRLDLILIDISNNSFEGKIPESIGKLNGIWSLNISNNILTGSIPSSLGNLSRLESLDLSHNKFSGVIPQQLAKLDFLAKFNVSYNNLRGPVPYGNHFATFDSTSYLGNPGLCGDSLPTKCGDSETLGLPPSREEENDYESGGFEFCWKFVLAGVLSGLVVGVVLADVAITRWPEWFSMIVGMLIRQMKRRRDTTVGQKSGLMKRRPRN